MLMPRAAALDLGPRRQVAIVALAVALVALAGRSGESAAPPLDAAASPNLRDFGKRYPQPRGFARREAGVFYLDLHDFGVDDKRRQGTLLRELPRQAMLIAARDGLRLRTRDRSLREELPFVKNPSEFPLSVITGVTENFLATISVIRHTTGGVELLWEQQHQLDPVRPREALATIAERLAREDFLELLKNQGYAQQPRIEDSSEFDKQVTTDLIDGMTEYGQLAVLRDLHARLRAGDESPEVVGALVRAYANLSNLSIYYCGPQFKAFAARAWLYAERAVAESNGSAEALDHRAYARALTGYFDSALTDLEAAAKTRQTDPAWRPLIEGLCLGDIALLEKAQESEPGSAFAAYLVYLLQSRRSDVNLQTAVTRELMQRAPDCLRAQFTLGFIKTLGTLRTAPRIVQGLPEITRRGLSEFVDLPADVEKHLGPAGLQQASEYAELSAALRRAGRPQADSAEPSLDAVGQMLNEIAFLAAWRVIHVEAVSLSVDPLPDLKRLQPLCPEHPYAEALELFVTRTPKMPAAVKFFERIDKDDFEVGSSQILGSLFNAAPQQSAVDRRTADLSNDHSLFEILTLLDVGTESNPRELYSKKLGQVAKWHPVTLEWSLTDRAPDLAQRLPEVEKSWNNDAPMLGVVADAYLILDDTAAARRCCLRQIELGPTYEAYTRLAKAEQIDGNHEAWLAALEQALKQPVTGLQHARTRVDISQYYRRRAEPKVALPYARDAAESYAAWALSELVEVYTRLEEWNDAEAAVRILTERYDNEFYKWATWCLRTGKGDLQAALQKAAPRILEINKDTNEYVQITAIMIDLCNQNAKRASTRGMELARRGQLSNYYWLAFMLADGQGDDALRLEMIKGAAAAAKGPKPGRMRGSEVIADHIVQRLEAGRTDLDLNLIDVQMSRVADGGPTWLWCILGVYLARHDASAAGAEYLHRAAESPINDMPVQWFAAYLLRNAGQTVGPMRRVEYVAPTTLPDSVGGTEIAAAEPLIHVQFFKDNQNLLYTNYDGRIVLWNPATGNRQSWIERQGMLADIAPTGNEALLLSNRNDEVALWSGSGEPKTLFKMTDARVWGAQFLPTDRRSIIRLESETTNPRSGRYIVSRWPKDGTAAKWQTKITGITVFGYSAAGAEDRIVVAGQDEQGDGWLGLYAASDGRELQTASLAGAPLARLAVSRDGRTAVTLSPKGVVTIWNVADLKQVHQYTLPDAHQAAISHDGQLLAIAADSAVHLYDVATRRPVCVVKDCLREVTSLSFSDDGTQLAVSSRDLTARVWPVELLRGLKSAPESSRPLQLVEELLSSLQSYSFGVGAADLDGDGDLDITYADALRNSDLHWFISDGSGNSSGLSYHMLIEDMPRELGRHVFADINKDGRLDVIIGEGRHGNLVWLQNEGRPQLESPWKKHFIAQGDFSGAYDCAVADYDGDGDLDVAANSCANGNVLWFENSGSPEDGRPWKAHVISEGLGELRCMRAADFDCDGDSDLLVSARVRGQVLWYENTGRPAAQGWKQHVVDDQASRATHGEPCDMDGDGDRDIVMSLGFGPEEDQGTPHEVVWYENGGDPRKQPWAKHRISELHQAFDAFPVDLDSDGDLDVLATGWSTPGRLVWCENSGDPETGWTTHVIKEPWTNANQVIAADFNGDGRPDIAATADQGSNQLIWWINAGRQ